MSADFHSILTKFKLQARNRKRLTRFLTEAIALWFLAHFIVVAIASGTKCAALFTRTLEGASLALLIMSLSTTRDESRLEASE